MSYSSSITNRGAFGAIRSTFRTLGVDLPAGFTEALAAIDARLEDRERHRLTFSPRALGEAVARALEAGRDPATDKTVLSELARERLASDAVRHQLDAVAEDRRAAVLAEHAPALVDALAPVVAAADATLTRAREQIDGLDLTDATAVGRLRPAQMSLWGEAREAADRCDRAAKAWALLAAVCGLAYVPHDKQPLILADLDATQLAALGRNPKPVAAVHAGHRLDLATPETFAARTAAVDRQRDTGESAA